MIPVSAPVVGEREAAYVAECLETGWISSNGRFIDAFENAWAEYCGRRHGVAVANGTVALQLAVAALGIGPGDEVILPTFTIVSCALAVIYAGATPVLVDADPETWCMDTSQVEARITGRTRAIMPVHIYGLPGGHGAHPPPRPEARRWRSSRTPPRHMAPSTCCVVTMVNAGDDAAASEMPAASASTPTSS